MAVPAKKPSAKELERIDHRFPENPPVDSENPRATAGTSREDVAKDVRLVAARLYGRGYRRGEIARALADQLVPNSRAKSQDQLYSRARSKLRRWEMSQEFRDLVYQHAVVELDMQTPQILRGVGRRASRGRVDAARLALEVTGRHNPKGAEVETNVLIRFDGVPRPGDDG